ncbi:MAG: hypothetical protein QXQ94_08535 [Candidatus Bathyarchaeia archaeon]
MSQSFENAVKNLLTQMGKNAGFSCKNEYRLRINGLSRYIAYIDHVWLEKVPHPLGHSREIPVVAFEITKDISTLWNMKKMKGDIENLRLSNAALGVLVIPTLDDLKSQAKNYGTGSETWLENLESYLRALKMIGFPLRLEIWCFDIQRNIFSSFPIT